MSEVRGDYPKISTGHPEAGRAFANALDSSLAREAKLLADFDRVTAERDALQALLTAADERADVLEGLLRDSKDVMSGIWDTSYDHEAGDVLAALDLMERIDAALKPAEGRNEPNCLRCLDKKTVPSNLAEGYVMDCPGCCGEEG